MQVTLLIRNEASLHFLLLFIYLFVHVILFLLRQMLVSATYIIIITKLSLTDFWSDVWPHLDGEVFKNEYSDLRGVIISLGESLFYSS